MISIKRKTETEKIHQESGETGARRGGEGGAEIGEIKVAIFVAVHGGYNSIPEPKPLPRRRKRRGRSREDEP